MNIGIKYCGGCNSRYDRQALLNQLIKSNPSIKFTHQLEAINMDLLIVLCGCTAACASIPQIKKNLEIMIVTNATSFSEIQSRISKIKNEIR